MFEEVKVGSQESPVSPGGETAASEKDVMPTILQVKLEDSDPGTKDQLTCWSGAGRLEKSSKEGQNVELVLLPRLMDLLENLGISLICDLFNRRQVRVACTSDDPEICEVTGFSTDDWETGLTPRPHPSNNQRCFQ